MEGLNPVYKLALGALWTSGRDLPGFDKETRHDRHALQTACGGPRVPNDFAQFLRDGGAREAARALEGMGFPLSDIGQALATAGDGERWREAGRSAADVLTMLEPAELPAPSIFATAGDVVELGQPWQGLDRVTLQGRRGQCRVANTFANPGGGWHYGRASHVLSMGNGGPASLSYIDLRAAVPTGETCLQRVWSFESTPRAHTGVDWALRVPVWRIDAPAFLDYEEAEELRLIGA